MMLCALGAAFAQEDDAAKRDKIYREVQEFKMNYLAQEMDLSEDQKKKFIEVYEEMNESRHQCFKEAMHMDRKLKKDKDASEEDYAKVTEAFSKANAQWAEMEKAYNEKFSEFLSQKQIYKMKEAENSFRVKLEEMKHNRKKDHRKPSHK